MTSNEIWSYFSSYILGFFVWLSSHDVNSVAAFLGCVLVVVKIAGDIPTALQKWREWWGQK